MRAVVDGFHGYQPLPIDGLPTQHAEALFEALEALDLLVLSPMQARRLVGAWLSDPERLSLSESERPVNLATSRIRQQLEEWAVWEAFSGISEFDPNLPRKTFFEASSAIFAAESLAWRQTMNIVRRGRAAQKYFLPRLCRCCDSKDEALQARGHQLVRTLIEASLAPVNILEPRPGQSLYLDLLEATAASMSDVEPAEVHCLESLERYGRNKYIEINGEDDEIKNLSLWELDDKISEIEANIERVKKRLDSIQDDDDLRGRLSLFLERAFIELNNLKAERDQKRGIIAAIAIKLYDLGWKKRLADAIRRGQSVGTMILIINSALPYILYLSFCAWVPAGQGLKVSGITMMWLMFKVGIETWWEAISLFLMTHPNLTLKLYYAGQLLLDSPDIIDDVDEFIEYLQKLADEGDDEAQQMIDNMEKYNR